MRHIISKLKNLTTKRNRVETKITSLEKMSLRISGMRGESFYEMIGEDEGIALSLYRSNFLNGSREMILIKRVICKREEILELLNSCCVIRWNGFNGKHPKGVKDGEMFDFTATVNGGEQINATGSANYPSHYIEFNGALYRFLNQS